jgi:hypothetical protein
MKSIQTDVNLVLLEALFPNLDGPTFWFEVPNIHFMVAKWDLLFFSSEYMVVVGIAVVAIIL